jgi:hypothetical protein
MIKCHDVTAYESEVVEKSRTLKCRFYDLSQYFRCYKNHMATTQEVGSGGDGEKQSYPQRSIFSFHYHCIHGIV